jgi:hypothetical protein
VSRVVRETSWDLSVIARDVSDASERLRAKELFLNAQFDSVAKEYKEVLNVVMQSNQMHDSFATRASSGCFSDR